MKESDIYNQTINESKEESMKKAIELVEASLNPQKKELIRPDIKPLRGVMKIALVIAFGVVLALMQKRFPWVFAVGMVILFMVTAFNLKKAVIWSVLCYQKYAPEKMRQSCLFTPSCSEYMILAVEKYGVVKGVFKGINRILRCHNPNGGVDYP